MKIISIVLLLASVAFSDPPAWVEIGVRASDGRTFVVPIPALTTQPTTAPVDPTILPPLAALPADAIRINSPADLPKLQQLKDNSVVSFLRGVTYPLADTIYIKANDFRLTAHGDPSLSWPVLKWAHPTSVTGDDVLVIGTNVQIDSILFDGGGGARGISSWPSASNTTIRDCKFDHIEDCVNAHGDTGTLMTVYNCEMKNPAGMRGYELFYTGGTYHVWHNICAGSLFQHNVRGVGSYHGAHNSWNVLDGKECVTAVAGDFTEEDSTFTSTGPSGDAVTFGPLAVQDLFLTSATVRRCRLVNMKIKMVGNVGDVLLEDLIGGPKPTEPFVWAGHGSGDTTRKIGSLTMRGFGGVVLPPDSKMFEQSISIGSVTGP